MNFIPQSEKILQTSVALLLLLGRIGRWRRRRSEEVVTARAKTKRARTPRQRPGVAAFQQSAVDGNTLDRDPLVRRRCQARN